MTKAIKGARFDRLRRALNSYCILNALDFVQGQVHLNINLGYQPYKKLTQSEVALVIAWLDRGAPVYDPTMEAIRDGLKKRASPRKASRRKRRKARHKARSKKMRLTPGKRTHRLRS